MVRPLAMATAHPTPPRSRYPHSRGAHPAAVPGPRARHFGKNVPGQSLEMAYESHDCASSITPLPSGLSGAQFMFLLDPPAQAPFPSPERPEGRHINAVEQLLIRAANASFTNRRQRTVTVLLRPQDG